MLADHGYSLGRGDVVAWIPVVFPRIAVELLFDDLPPLRESIASVSEIMADRALEMLLSPSEGESGQQDG